LPAASSSSPLQKIPEQRMAVLGKDRLRVELHAFDRERLVAHAHDLSVIGPRADLEASGQARPLDRKRMIAGCLETVGQSFEYAAAVVVDRGDLAVHQLGGVNDVPAESLAYALVAQAHPQDRSLAGKALDERHRDARFVGRARPGRNDDARRI